LVYINYDVLSNALNLDEPWDGPNNSKCLSGLRIEELVCPETDRDSGDFSSNYMAIIGPSTIWRIEGTVKLSELPDRGSHTVALVEVVSSGKHWAQPFALTAEEALENLKTGKGVRISTCHPDGVNVLFADGVVRSLPTRMPLSLWRNILAGEICQDLNRLDEQIDPDAPDMVDVYTGPPIHASWTIMLGVIIWLTSVALLFFRAIASRKIAGKLSAESSSHARGVFGP
jgi:prepilin-type processing-associated H-X9-DG protein